MNGSEDDAPAGIDTDPGLTDEPPLGDKVMSTSVPDELVTGFWNWSMSTIRAVTKLAMPSGGAGLAVQLSESPTVPVQVTWAGVPRWPLPVAASVKVRPAAGPAVTVSVWVPAETPAATAVMTG